MLSIEEVLERYQVKVDTLHPANSDGLDKEIVTSRLAQYGPNVMSPPKKIHPILKYLISLSNLFNVLLIVSGVLCYILFAIDSVGNATQV